MPRIKLFLMRHSKSCCNLVREDEQNVDLSQAIRDPALSAEGRRVAALYGPMLRPRLTTAGFDVDGALITSSKLRRAKETAALVFGRALRILDYFTENGAIPENTPASQAAYSKPDWKKMLKQLAAMTKDGDSVVTVGHGSFLRSLWPILTGHERRGRLNNLDGILLDIDVIGGKVHGHREIRCSLTFRAAGDKCMTADARKIAALSKMTRTKKTMRSRKQHGGFATSMPLGFHKDGAQFAGTFPYPTGTQTVFPTEGTYVRAPMVQGPQAGGFSPSVMGSFAANGARLIPIAGYMGYRMLSNQKKTRKRSRSRRQRK